MRLTCAGAAGEVTGSRHLLRTSRGTILLDCGLVQGRRREANERNRTLGFRPREVDLCVLSHAHIDHSGALPMLLKGGFTGPIFTTPATRNLAAALLEDSALIQAADARYINRRIAKGHEELEPVEPLYDEADVARALARMVAVPYGVAMAVAPGITLTFEDAGHVLGSAVVLLDIDDDGVRRRVVFSGDLGRAGRPILRDPTVVSGADALILESTYGGRTHPPVEGATEALAELVRRTVARGGRVIVPAFALERAQELVYELGGLRRGGRIPAVPVYVDSPLAVRVTDVFKLHPECYDDDARRLLEGGQSPFDFPGLIYVGDAEESKALSTSGEPCVILSASGMCEAGRVLHHLKAAVEDPRNAVAIVGFQAAHTLGRRIVERRPRVRIFGVERELRAEVATLEGLSAHADEPALVAYAEALRERGPLRQIVLVHGEPPAQAALAQALRSRGFPTVHVPSQCETLSLS